MESLMKHRYRYNRYRSIKAINNTGRQQVQIQTGTGATGTGFNRYRLQPYLGRSGWQAV